MIRVLWFLLLIAVGLAAAANQLDRQSRIAPALSANVPEYFRGFAHRQLVDDAIKSQDYAAALDEAHALIADRPIPAEHLVMLAKAALGAGDEEQAARALSEAGARGWRDPVAQDAVAVAALQDGDMTVAAERIAAMWAVNAPQERVDQLAAQLLSNVAGRQAFAARLAAGGRWQDKFTNPKIAQDDPEAFADTVVRAERLGFRLPCSRLKPAAENMARQGRQDLADRFYSDRCGASAVK